MKSKKNITMKEAKNITGLSSRQIRYYDEQNLVFPGRSSGNQRLFSENDIKRLVKIKKFLAEGNSIETVRTKLNPPVIEEKIEADEYDDIYNEYSDVDLDSLYPVSNRSALVKKLSQSHNDKSQEEEN